MCTVEHEHIRRFRQYREVEPSGDAWSWMAGKEEFDFWDLGHYRTTEADSLSSHSSKASTATTTEMPDSLRGWTITFSIWLYSDS